MTRREKLIAASVLIDEVRSKLDLSHEICECCQLKRYGNFAQAQAHLELTALHRKLTIWAKSPLFAGTDTSE